LQTRAPEIACGPSPKGKRGGGVCIHFMHDQKMMGPFPPKALGLLVAKPKKGGRGNISVTKNDRGGGAELGLEETSLH